jgi:hypothetical protein
MVQQYTKPFVLETWRADTACGWACNVQWVGAGQGARGAIRPCPNAAHSSPSLYVPVAARAGGYGHDWGLKMTEDGRQLVKIGG